jgi:hypothetical protein
MRTEPSKILYSADGKRRVVIERRSDGSFGCAEGYWFENFYEGDLVAKGWAHMPTDKSVFESLDIAEREAKARFAWLR